MKHALWTFLACIGFCGCQESEVVVDSTESLSALPAAQDVYGCDYGVAFETSVTPMAEVIAREVAAVIPSGILKNNDFGLFADLLPTVEVALGDVHVEFISEPDGEVRVAEPGTPMFRLVFDMRLRVRSEGFEIGNFDDTWFATRAEVSVPVEITAGATDDGIELTASPTDEITINSEYGLSSEGQLDDPLVPLFAKLIDSVPPETYYFTSEDYAFVARFLLTEFIQATDSKAISIPIPRDLLGEYASYTVFTEGVGSTQRLGLIDREGLAGCSGNFALSHQQLAQGFAAVFVHPERLRSIIETTMHAAVEPILSSFEGQLTANEITLPSWVDLYAGSVSLTETGFTARPLELPPVAIGKYVGSPVECFVWTTLQGFAEVEVATEYQQETEYLHIVSFESKVSLAHGGKDSLDFDACKLGSDGLSEEIWDDAVIDGFGPIEGLNHYVEQAENEAARQAFRHLQPLALTMENGLNEVFAQLNEFQFAPNHMSFGANGFRVAGRLRASQAQINYIASDFPYELGPVLTSVLGVEGAFIAEAVPVACDELYDGLTECPAAVTWDHHTIALFNAQMDFTCGLLPPGGTVALATGSSIVPVQCTGVTPGSVLSFGSGHFAFVQDRSTRFEYREEANVWDAYPIIRLMTIDPMNSATPPSLPEWPDAEPVVAPPSVSIGVSYEPTAYSVTVEQSNLPGATSDGLTVGSYTWEIKRATQFRLDWEPKVLFNQYEGYVAIYELEVRVNGVLQEGTSMLVPYQEGGTNTYVVELTAKLYNTVFQILPGITDFVATTTIVLPSIVETKKVGESSVWLTTDMARDSQFVDPIDPLRFDRVAVHTLGDRAAIDIVVLEGISSMLYIDLPRTGLVDVRGTRAAQVGSVEIDGISIPAQFVHQGVFKVLIPSNLVSLLGPTPDVVTRVSANVLDPRGRAIGQLGFSTVAARGVVRAEQPRAGSR